MFVGVSDCLVHHLRPLFFPPCVSRDCTALETRTFQRCCCAASKQKFQGNVWMFRLAGKDNSPRFCVPLFGWKLSLTFSNLIWSFIISQRKCNLFPSCSWCATAGLPGDVRIPICSQNAHIWGWPLQKLRMSTELFTTNSQSACEWGGKGWNFNSGWVRASRSKFHTSAKKLIRKA